MIHFRIQVFGKKAHGAYNWQGINAIEITARIISKLKALRFKFKKHALLRGPTVNIGVIHGGDKVNMVCDFCEVAVDLRFLPGMKPQDILKIVHKTIQSETRKYKIVIDDLQTPYEIKKDHPAIKLFYQTLKKMKCPGGLRGSEGATVITFFQKYHIAAFATGFAAHGTAHTNDEYIYVKDLCRGTRFLEQYIKDYDQL